VKALDVELAQAYADTFISRWNMYPYQRDDGSYITIQKRLTLEVVQRHLLGVFPTLGVYALDKDSQAKWVCFDADDDGEWYQLKNMAADLTRSNVTGFLEPSRRGGHLWLFTPKIGGLPARQFAEGLLDKYQAGEMEFFPKQAQLATGPGSLVRLPLGIHKKTGKRYHFVDAAGEPLAPSIREQVQILSAPPLVPRAFIEQVIAAHQPKARLPSPRPRQNKYTPEKSGDSVPLSERIKQRMSVLDFVSQYVELDAAGHGHCPFHNDQHKSFGVNEKEGYWSCFAQCGDGEGLPNGGSIIDFWQRWRHQHGEDYSFSATLHDLAKMLL